MMFDDQPRRSQFIQDSCSWSIVTSALIKQFGLLQVLFSQKLSLLHQIFLGLGFISPPGKVNFLLFFYSSFVEKVVKKTHQKDSSKKKSSKNSPKIRQTIRQKI